jgi:predicted phage tail protein
MIGGKAQANTKPTSFGTLVQASTYGATIPTIYGTTRVALNVIWAANIRQGKCNPKKGKF